HPNSLVDPATHSPALLELISIKVSRPVIEYLVDCVVETVDYAMGRPTPSSSRGRSRGRRPEHAKFSTFVKNVIERAEINIQTIIASLVYIDRAKPHLHIALEEWALERVFLGAIIVASKYLNDSTLKNVHWALCTGVFGKRDVGRIEREYLDVLDFELGVTEADLLSHHQGLLNAVFPTSHAYRNQHLQFTHSHSATSRTVSSQVSSAPVPELSPSSDESSSGSSSPRTPSTLDSSPSYSPEHGKRHQTQSAPKKSFQTSTLELLRSFPIPLPQPAHQRQESHPHMPVRIRS
ncbi:hypothetical protein P691DRAFT_631794, partial [Macrolepiota fuliginosa MF-IS2]